MAQPEQKIFFIGGYPHIEGVNMPTQGPAVQSPPTTTAQPLEGKSVAMSTDLRSGQRTVTVAPPQQTSKLPG